MLWRAWPWVSWFLPVALFALLLGTGSGGWELLIVVLFSPILLPVCALLGVLPRFILRRVGGFRSSTTLVSIAMIAHWWGFVLFAISYRGTGDSGRVDSVLGEWFFRLPVSVEGVLSATGACIVFVSYLVALVGVASAMGSE